MESFGLSGSFASCHPCHLHLVKEAARAQGLQCEQVGLGLRRLRSVHLVVPVKCRWKHCFWKHVAATVATETCSRTPGESRVEAGHTTDIST